jgi:hypothetical protein
VARLRRGSRDLAAARDALTRRQRRTVLDVVDQRSRDHTRTRGDRAVAEACDSLETVRDDDPR